jgi:tetratricopeptide (TPR) repeat protein
MESSFLSSEEYDERAHQLYNEGRFDEALDVLREGLALYPHAVELHVGVGYARLAREEYAWARRAFDEALVLHPEHEDALAGLGETLLRFNQIDLALAAFRRVLELGYDDDIDLMLQCGRALFRDGLIAEAQEFFDAAVLEAPDSAEAHALVGYCQHRRGDDAAALRSLQRALALDPDFAEARVYLGNLLYDDARFDEALAEFERTTPEDHWDELAIWRTIELLQTYKRLPDDDPELKLWHERLAELDVAPDAIDAMLEEIERAAMDAAEKDARSQLELFGAMLAEVAQRQAPQHRVVLGDGREFEGTWEEIVQQMRGLRGGRPSLDLHEFMQIEARRVAAQTGVPIPDSDAESFVRGSASAGVLRIVGEAPSS